MKIKRIVSIMLVLTLCFSFAITPAAASTLESETVFIDGISYTYDYIYENNYRIIYVTNNNDNSIEKVSYDLNTSTIYYNDKAIGKV